jgi:hypothetical protein
MGMAGMLVTRVRAVAIGTAATVAVFVSGAGVAYAGDSNACGSVRSIGRTAHHGPMQVQYCQLWNPVPVSAIPVFSSKDDNSEVVDVLYSTNGNWFVGQDGGGEYYDGYGHRNFYWAYTMGDEFHWGWVPLTYFVGGSNDYPDAGLRWCVVGGSNICHPY